MRNYTLHMPAYSARSGPIILNNAPCLNSCLILPCAQNVLDSVEGSDEDPMMEVREPPEDKGQPY